MIFLVIIGLWAAYLVPHWLRRCEQLSASRSADRFSAAMRVLARRSEAPPEERRAVSRSYVLMPPGESVRGVVVKRPRPVDDWTPRPRDESRRDENLHDQGLHGEDLLGESLHAEDPQVGRREGLQDTSRRAAPRPAPGPPRQDPAAPGSRARPPRLLPVSLLGLVTAAPALAVLGLVGVAPLWSPLPALGLALAIVVILRTRVVQARASQAGASQRTSSRSTRSRSTTGPQAPGSPRSATVASRPSAASVGPSATQAAGEARGGSIAVQADPVPTVQEAVAGAGGWTPVPVPPPTYTLKAHAPRRRLASAALAQVAPAQVAPASEAAAAARPAPAPWTDAPGPPSVAAAVTRPGSGPRTDAPLPAFDLDAVLERRRASGE